MNKKVKMKVLESSSESYSTLASLKTLMTTTPAIIKAIPAAAAKSIS